MVAVLALLYAVTAGFYGLWLDKRDPDNERAHDIPAILWPLDVASRIAGAVTQKLLPPPGDDVP